MHNKNTRITLKIIMGLICLVSRPIVSCLIWKLILTSKQKSKKMIFKLFGNLIYIVGYINYFGFNNDYLILDQGLLQALWSIEYSSNKDFDISYAQRIIDSVLKREINIITVHVDEDIVLDRIVKRNRKSGRLEYFLDDYVKLKKNISIASLALIKIEKLISTSFTNNKVSVIKVSNNNNNIEKKIDQIIFNLEQR